MLITSSQLMSVCVICNKKRCVATSSAYTSFKSKLKTYSWDVKLLTLRVNGWRKIRNLDFLRVLRRQNALHGAHLVRVLGCRLDLVRKIQSGATGIFSKAFIENSQFGDDFLLTRALVLRLRRRVKVEDVLGFKEHATLEEVCRLF